MNKIILLILVLSLAGFHLLFLDSDPSPIKRWGDACDEGYWIHNARLNTLFENYNIDDMQMSRFGAPLFNFLTEYSFKIFGVSYFSARLIPIISYWLILIMIFFILRDHIGSERSIRYAFLFGIIHEVLMYAKWATPVITEMMFLLAIMFFYRLKHKNKYYCFLSGVAFALAILTKLTAVLFAPSLIIFILWEFKSNKTFFQEILLLISGTIFIILPVLVIFVFPNLYNFGIMFDYPAYTAGFFNIILTIKNLILIPLNFTLFKYPSTVFIFIFSLLYFADKITNLIIYPRYDKSHHISTIEKFFISWIVGITISLCINNQMGYDRRMVGLFIPFYILSIIYFSNSSDIMGKLKSASSNKFFIIFSLYLLIFSLSCFYLGSIYKTSLSHWFGDGNPILENGNSEFGLMIYFLPFGFYFLFLIINYKTFFLKKILLMSLISFSVLLNIVWYTNSSFTVRDSLKNLINHKTNDNFIAGHLAHWIAAHTYLKPIWYCRSYDKNDDFNKWFFDYKKEKNFLLVSQSIPSEGIRGRSFFIDIDLFKKENLKLNGELNLSPMPFTGTFREKLKIYEVN